MGLGIHEGRPHGIPRSEWVHRYVSALLEKLNLDARTDRGLVEARVAFWWPDDQDPSAVEIAAEWKTKLPEDAVIERYYGLLAFERKFEAIVLEHLKLLPEAEWARLRTAAMNCPKSLAAMPGWNELRKISTREELVAAGCSEPWAKLYEAIPARGTLTVIGQLEGQPVLYCEPSGIYAWSPDPHEPPMLDLWITAPAYPPAY